MDGSPDNKLFLTADGSHSLQSLRYDVPYHSIHGAVQESRHVFIDAGLRPVAEAATGTVRILELGFGTGLNALLTRQFAGQRLHLQFAYFAFERFPLDEWQIAELNYPAVLDLPVTDLKDLHSVPFTGAAQRLTDNFTLAKTGGDYLRGLPGDWRGTSFDVVFYDAFAPTSQPELWTPSALEIAHRALRPGGFLVTYCAKGQFKRDLKTLGFRVEALPGPPGKREMTRGVK